MSEPTAGLIAEFQCDSPPLDEEEETLRAALASAFALALVAAVVGAIGRTTRRRLLSSFFVQAVIETVLKAKRAANPIEVDIERE